MKLPSTSNKLSWGGWDHRALLCCLLLGQLGLGVAKEFSLDLGQNILRSSTNPEFCYNYSEGRFTEEKSGTSAAFPHTTDQKNMMHS